jgi:exosome complex protein LRP1
MIWLTSCQAGNDKYDLERAEREAKEKAMAQLRAVQLARQKASLPQSLPVAQSSSDSSAEEAEDDPELQDGENTASPAPKRPRTISNDPSTQERRSRRKKVIDKNALKSLRKERRRAKRASKRQKITSPKKAS